MLVQSRTKLINHVRCVVKTRGDRLPKCSTASFAKRAEVGLPEPLAASLNPVIKTIGELTAKIKQIDQQIRYLNREQYPETQLLQELVRSRL